MPYENEYAGYEPLRRILESPQVSAIRDRFKKKLSASEDQVEVLPLINANNLETTNWKADLVVGIDGSFHSVDADTGYPGAEYGYVTVASVVILLDKIRELSEAGNIHPKEYRKTEKPVTFDAVYPGCNVIIDGENDPVHSFRLAFYEQLSTHSAFEEGESLLDTYNALIQTRISSTNVGKKRPDCPYNTDHKLEYNQGAYLCPVCRNQLYATDALRLHELLNAVGSSGEMYGQAMMTIEKLWLVHVIRAFEIKRNWIRTLGRMVFVIDGPLAVYSTSAWLSQTIKGELRRLNRVQKEKTHTDLLILGIEKTGNFVNHFEAIDITDKNGVPAFPNRSFLLLTDNYIKKNIILSSGREQYGASTYFGRKLFYKTSNGHRLVVSVATFSDRQDSLETANINQFPRISDIAYTLDQLSSNRYPNAVIPLISAHSEASIPLNIGKKLFDELANEIADA